MGVLANEIFAKWAVGSAAEAGCSAAMARLQEVSCCFVFTSQDPSCRIQFAHDWTGAAADDADRTVATTVMYTQQTLPGFKL